MKGFIEVQERYYSPSSEKWVNLNGKTSLNITHIAGFKENNIHTFGCNEHGYVTIEVKESYEQIKQLIKESQL